MYQRILVPIDGSAASAQGLEEAIRLAKLTNGQIRLLHVIETPTAFYPDVAVAGLLEQMEEAAKGVMSKARVRVVDAGVAVDTLLETDFGSSLAEAVQQQINQWNADLVVIGTHGRRGLRRMVLGSDAEEVLRRVKVPVLMVHAPDATGSGS
jgi:nucleotide-binding universal stress UspA family protein